MAGNITEAFTRQFANTVYNLVSVKGGMFKNKCDERTQVGEFANYQTLGAAVAGVSSTDHGAATVISDLSHSQRVCARTNYDIALLVDKFEQVQTLVDFRSPYTNRIAESLSRKRDIETIRGALKTAITGKTGSGTTIFDYTNQVIPVATGDTGATGMNVAKLRAVKAKFWQNGYTNMDKMYIALTGTQISDLLASTEITSVDFNTVRALVQGEINQFMGIEIVQSEQVPFLATAGTALTDLTGAAAGWDAATDAPVDQDSTSTRGTFAWVKNAILVGEAIKPTVSIDIRPDLKLSWQVFGCISVGAVRMEEKGVILVPNLES